MLQALGSFGGVLDNEDGYGDTPTSLADSRDYVEIVYGIVSLTFSLFIKKL